MDYTLIEARPGNSAVLLPNEPEFTVVAVSNDFAATAGISRKNIVGSDFFTHFPKSPDDPDFTGEKNLRASFHQVISKKQPHLLALQRYDILQNDGSFIEKYWKAHNVPVLSETGDIRYIIHTAEDITDHVKATRKAAQLKGIQRAYDLFMQAPVAICIVNGPDYIVELANEHMLQLLGRTAAMVGKPIEESLPEANVQGLLSILDHVRNTGESFNAPNFSAQLLIDGAREQRYFDLVFQLYYQSEKETGPASVFCVAYDVTKQILAQKQLESVQSETERQKRLYEAITGNTPDLIYVFDMNYRFIYVNDALLTMWGKNWEEAIGKRLLQNGYEPWHAEMHERELDQVMITKRPLRGEVSFPHATFGSRIYDYIFVPVFNKDGEVEAVAGTSRDITEIKQAEQSIRESEERFRNIADESPLFVFIIDPHPDAPVNYWNKTWLEYTGQTIEEAIDRAWDRIIHPDDVSVVMDHYIPSFQNRQSYFIPAIRVKRHDGVYRWHAFKSNPRYKSNGNFNGYVGVGFDIHDQKISEEAVRQSEAELQIKVAERTAELEKVVEELKRSNASLEDFAYAASHDLKEPIRKIQIFSDRLKGQLQHTLNETQNGLFDRLENASKRMGSLIDDLLTYSQATNDASDHEVVDLNKKVQLVLEDLELEVQQKGAKVTVDPLPTIKGNNRQIQQLLQNLIGNALKYTKPNSIPEIKITSRQVRGQGAKDNSPIDSDGKMYHQIEVQDNGIGFKQENAERIFNIFTRLHTNAEYRGSGVGLSIVQKVVENHNGSIWAESKEGEGSTFKVLLPAE